MEEIEIIKIGEVVSVDGRMIKIRVFKTKNSSNLFYKGKIIKNVGTGSYIKILKGFIRMIAKVDSEYIQEDKQAINKEYKNMKDKIERYVIVKLLGFFDENNKFVRGIKEMPLVFNECFLLTEEEFNKVHNFVDENDNPLKIGVLSLEKGQDISVGINSLFASHFGIFGNTGSGKSYTIASIYRKLFLKYKNKFKENSKFYLFDFNGEYIDQNVIIEDEYKNKYRLSTRDNNGDKFPITEDTINDVEFWAIFLTATDKTQKPFIKRTLDKKDIDNQKIENLVDEILKEGYDVLFEFLEMLKTFLENEININNLRENLHYHSKDKTYYFKEGNESHYSNSDFMKVKEKVKSLLGNNCYKTKELSKLGLIHLKFIFYYFQEIVWDYSNQEHLSPLIKRLEKRIKELNKVIEVVNKLDKNEKFLSIISLKDVNLDMRKVLPLLFCKQIYDIKKKETNFNKYLNIIIDEAHNILSYESQRESEIWKDYRLETFEEIIKEGRKFGTFLTIASQRPADVSATIISQLHNYFLHRLINERDIQAVERTISYLDKVSFEYLSILPTGTCIFAGVATSIPIIVDTDPIEEKYEPKNKTIKLTEIWNNRES